MSDEQGQAPEQTEQVQETEQTQEPKQGATAFYKQQVQTYKSQMDEIAQQNKALQERLAQIEEEKLISANKYKEAYELAKREKDEVSSKFDEFKGLLISDKKKNALREAALKANIRKEALDDLDLLDTNDLEIETTSTGRLNILGADDYIDTLKTRRPHWFSSSTQPNINNAMPEINQGKPLSMGELLKLEKTDKAAYYREYKKLLEAKHKKV